MESTSGKYFMVKFHKAPLPMWRLYVRLGIGIWSHHFRELEQEDLLLINTCAMV